MSARYDHDAVDVLREALFGRSVVAVKKGSDRTLGTERWDSCQAEGEVHLDDGTVLLLAGHEGGCACSAGCYDLTDLNAMPINGITNVEVEANPDDEDLPCATCGKTYWCEHERPVGNYRIFVIAQDERLALATFEGSDGNGYYGTGFWFSIVAPDPS